MSDRTTPILKRFVAASTAEELQASLPSMAELQRLTVADVEHLRGAAELRRVQIATDADEDAARRAHNRGAQ